MIDVSVIIPTYNRLWCLPRAIESCKNTRCRTEIIVVDDGSSDGTNVWLAAQSGIIVVSQDNQGQTYAVNHGVSVSRGSYIKFLDSDDYLAPGIIDAQFAKAVESGAQLICSRVDNLDDTTKKIKVNPDINEWDDFLEIQLGSGYGSHFSGMLFHRLLVEQVPRRPDFGFREDRMFLLEVGLLNPKMAIVNGCGGYWVQHRGQMQSNYAGLKSQVVNWQHLNIYKKILTRLEREGRLTEKYKKASCTVLWPLAHWIAKQHLADAIEIVNWIYKLDPFFVPPEDKMLGTLYRRFGFKNTERFLKIRRFFLNLMPGSK